MLPELPMGRKSLGEDSFMSGTMSAKRSSSGSLSGLFFTSMVNSSPSPPAPALLYPLLGLASVALSGLLGLVSFMFCSQLISENPFLCSEPFFAGAVLSLSALDCLAGVEDGPDTGPMALSHKDFDG